MNIKDSNNRNENKTLTHCTYPVYYRNLEPTSYYVVICKDLDVGSYSIKLHADDVESVCDKLNTFANILAMAQDTTIHFDVTHPTTFSFGTEHNPSNIVSTLRQQLKENANNLNDIKQYETSSLSPGRYIITLNNASEIATTIKNFSNYNIPVTTKGNTLIFDINTIGTPVIISTTEKNMRKVHRQLEARAIIRNKGVKNSNDSLIKKEIKAHTDLGEEFNRTSFYDTISECIELGEDLIVDTSKSPADPDIKYLQMNKYMQDEAKLVRERQKLEQKIRDLKQKQYELMKY